MVADHSGGVLPVLVGPRTPSTDTSPTDLRLVDCTQVLAYVEDVLDVDLDRGRMRRKRRTISGPTGQGSWLRVEVRTDQRVAAQGWGGIEAAEVLTGIAKPGWYRSAAWRDPVHQVWWRADETQLITATSISPSATITSDPRLPQGWWEALRASLIALAAQPAARAAKLHAATASQDYLASLAATTTTLLAADPVDAHINEWTTAHADLTWANLTAPGCWLLDWEDWGRAPRGFDAATLLLGSLAVPTLAERARREFAADLGSRSGKVAVLALCAELLRYPECAGELTRPVRAEALSAVAGLAR